MLRRCPACARELVRKPAERRAEFLARTYCDHACSVADRGRRAQERREALDLEDAHVAEELPHILWDRAAIRRRAAQVAAGLPTHVLDAILDEVEPMIAANVRRRLLSPIAARIRADRP